MQYNGDKNWTEEQNEGRNVFKKKEALNLRSAPFTTIYIYIVRVKSTHQNYGYSTIIMNIKRYNTILNFEILIG